MLYLVLLFAPSIMLTLWGLSQRTGLAGSPALHFGVFVAFASIYPSAELLLRITAKWMALILAAIYTLQLLAYHSQDERSEEHTSELQSLRHLVCRLLLEKKKSNYQLSLFSFT